MIQDGGVERDRRTISAESRTASLERGASERAGVAAHLCRLLEEWGAGPADSLRPQIEARLAALGDGQLVELIDRVQSTGADWAYYPGHPFARHLSRDMMTRVLRPGSALEGGEVLDQVAGRPLVFVGNHLSFVDVNVLDHLLATSGHADCAGRLTSLVGPKVFSLPIRRLASLCFGVIKIPQSQAIASEEAVMSPREVARVASHTVEVARQRVAAGDHLLIFPEGSRSRTARMNRLRPAASRYLEVGDTLLVPWGHTGAESLVPIGEDHVYPACVTARIGTPVPTAALVERCQGKRALVADALGFLIAATLPEPYRGAYDGSDPALNDARQIALELAG